MIDLSQAREELLNDYIEEFAPSQQEIEAFMHGMTWMMGCITDKHRLNVAVPEETSNKWRDEEINRLSEKVELLEKENKRLKNELKQIKLLNHEERLVLKRELQYQSYAEKLSKLRGEFDSLREAYDILLSRYYCKDEIVK